MPNEETQVKPKDAVIKRNDMWDFEREQIHVERLKAWLTALSIFVSVIGSAAAAIVTYHSAQKVQSQQAAEAFQLKAAEIVMASRTPWEAQSKAKALATFFPDKVPAKMRLDPSEQNEKFDPEKHGWGRESHRELLTLLLTTNPTTSEHRAMVLKTWKAFFPGDKWVDEIPQIP